jgi:hypothetical protein
VLLRLAYFGVTNALALLRLLPMSDRAKDAEILALRHQIMVLERQLHGAKVRFAPADRPGAPLGVLEGVRRKDRLSSRQAAYGGGNGPDLGRPILTPVVPAGPVDRLPALAVQTATAS